MVMYMVAVTKVTKTESGASTIGDIVKSWKYNDLNDCKRQYKKVVKGLEIHGRTMEYNVELPNGAMMAQTVPIDGRSLWITLTKEEA